MNERERWVVYPLLFLALGASLRDKLAGRTATGSIVCEELIIMDDAPFGRQSERYLVRIGRTESSANNPAIGYVYVNGQMEVAGKVNAGAINAAAINAKQYAYGGIPFVPSFQAANWWRALEQTAKALQLPKDAGGEGAESIKAAQAAQSKSPKETRRAANAQPTDPSAGAE